MLVLSDMIGVVQIWLVQAQETSWFEFVSRTELFRQFVMNFVAVYRPTDLAPL